MGLSWSSYREMNKFVKGGYKKALKFNKLIEAYRIKVEAGSDNFTIISGKEGSGKSSFALTLAFKYHKKIKKKFDYFNNIVFLGDNYGVNEYFSKYKKVDKETSFIIDEAEALIPAVEHMKSGVKKVIKHIQSDIRKEKKLMVFLNTPTIRSIHTYIRNSRVDHWFYLFPRKYTINKNRIIGVLFKKYDSAFEISTSDPWELNKWHEFEKIYIKKNGDTLSTKLELMRGHPLYVGEFNKKPLIENKYKLYLKARDKTIKAFGRTNLLSEVGEENYNDIIINGLMKVAEYNDYKPSKIADNINIDRKRFRQFYNKYMKDLIKKEQEKRILERHEAIKKSESVF